MAHFAHLDANNVVKHVSVVSNDIETSDGPLGENDMHVDGETWCKNFHEGQKWTIDNGVVSWKQTSYNGNFRKRYATIGGTYDPVRDEFVGVKPHDSWVLNDTNDWVSPLANNPTEIPAEGWMTLFIWDEENQRWYCTKEVDDGSIAYWNPNTQQWDIQ